jgi:dipeptidyl aminopeptidase/acylaminoacyl peptidase
VSVINLRVVRRLVISLVLAGILGAIAFLVLLDRAFNQIGEAGSLAGADSGVTSISWAPDGKHIVVSRGEDDSEVLYRLDADGSDPRRLSSSDAAAEDPAVSPDGKQIAYVAIPGVSGVDLFVAGADGSDAKRLTHGDDFEGDPAWSPDGRRIAFVRGYDLDVQSDLYVTRADGTHVRRLTHGSDVEESPSWSPDGAWIAYEAFPNAYMVPARDHGKRRS